MCTTFIRYKSRLSPFAMVGKGDKSLMCLIVITYRDPKFFFSYIIIYLA